MRLPAGTGRRRRGGFALFRAGCVNAPKGLFSPVSTGFQAVRKRAAYPEIHRGIGNQISLLK
ncbi:hypothetical protein SAMN04487991_1282 [Celeribacter neptunius]|uniref:Uncharacterized protein n=1 Tax=Celeribacter neptunius TaxID=588602 RepID=A0A1I3N7R3_9RHOB|nr:hypothetical protein SAMN04487991_1282 [Celeribacter neptunius]